MDLVSRSVAARVASRYKAALAIDIGRTVEMGSVRIHRYRDVFQITDLTNAGRRGKKVRVMSVGMAYQRGRDEQEWMDLVSKVIVHHRTYDQVKRYFDSLPDGEADVSERMVRGVDVEPGGLTTIKLQTTPDASGSYVVIESKPTDWSVKSVGFIGGREDKPGTGTRMDTLYWPAGGKRDVAQGAKLFNAWLQDNLSKANRMSILELREVWRQLGIRYDSH